ncbi:amidase [Iamia sp. SCSIO 61187]|uniref:amidase n=1 Tax=Iamia sp. SCSIO 61187 TaxID=2722752 RepID=UPI001C62BF48|nr:amidase [Iamia sp. SCSIO 61187]
MADTPWQGDACSLVDAFRAGDRSPAEELEASLAAIEASDLRCFSFLDPERARQAAADADVALPFGGVPTGIKELEQVEGWPDTGASLVFADRVATHTMHSTQRLLTDGGVVPVGLTTASEFGGLNVSVTKLNGVTHNPWRHGRTVGGSSGGAAASVAGGLVSLSTGGDGGGSIRIPAGYTGLLGMKGTFGRTTRGPHAMSRPNTVVNGSLSRSVRDAARFLDVVSGPDPYDPTSLPKTGSYEAGLGTFDLSGLRVAVVPDLGGVTLEPGVEDRVRSEAELLVRENGMTMVDLDVRPPNLAAQWMMGNLSTLLAELGDRWPGCADDLTDEVAFGLYLSQSLYNLHTAAAAEDLRVQSYVAMAEAFGEVDLIIAATNPGPAFAADAATSNPQEDLIDMATSSKAFRYAFRGALLGTRLTSAFAPRLPAALLAHFSARFPDMVNMGALTIISNIYGNPAVSIPAGTIDGLPVGMQVLARHHADDLLFDVALAVERARPWPMVAPGVAAPAPA